MLELGGELDLATEPRRVGSRRHLRRQHLDDDPSLQPEILGDEDTAHPGTGELPVDVVGAGELRPEGLCQVGCGSIVREPGDRRKGRRDDTGRKNIEVPRCGLVRLEKGRQILAQRHVISARVRYEHHASLARNRQRALEQSAESRVARRSRRECALAVQAGYSHSNRLRPGVPGRPREDSRSPPPPLAHCVRSLAPSRITQPTTVGI